MLTVCPKCGSRDIDQGRIYSAGAVAYRSDLQRHPFVSANCQSWICMDCGYTESFVGPEYRDKIRRMRNREVQNKATGH